MAKKVTGMIKLQLPAGKATPAPPVGPALGQHGVNIMGFCKEFNAKTANQAGLIIPVVITVYKDKSFEFITLFSHPDSTVGIGISPIHARRLADCTAGWESHPAPKTIPMKLRPYYNTSPDARKGGAGEAMCLRSPAPIRKTS